MTDGFSVLGAASLPEQDPTGVWDYVQRIAARQARDNRLIQELGELLEARGRGGILVYRDGPDAEWQITESAFIPDDRIYLARLDAPDLGVKFDLDGGIQGLIQRKRED